MSFLAEIACYTGIEKGAFLAPFSILSSAIIGASVAIWAILSNRKSARLKNSIDFINSYNEAEDISNAIKEMMQLKDTGSTTDLELLANEDATEIEKLKHVRCILNFYEAMAICISHKIYDDKIIKEAIWTTVIDVWTTCLPYVKKRRVVKKSKTFFQEIEKLVYKWENSPLKSKK